MIVQILMIIKSNLKQISKHKRNNPTFVYTRQLCVFDTME